MSTLEETHTHTQANNQPPPNIHQLASTTTMVYINRQKSCPCSVRPQKTTRPPVSPRKKCVGGANANSRGHRVVQPRGRAVKQHLRAISPVVDGGQHGRTRRHGHVVAAASRIPVPVAVAATRLTGNRRDYSRSRSSRGLRAPVVARLTPKQPTARSLQMREGVQQRRRRGDRERRGRSQPRAHREGRRVHANVDSSEGAVAAITHTPPSEKGITKNARQQKQRGYQGSARGSVRARRGDGVQGGHNRLRGLNGPAARLRGPRRRHRRSTKCRSQCNPQF